MEVSSGRIFLALHIALRTRDKAVIGVDNGAGQVTLSALQLKNLPFNRIAGNQSVGKNALCLPNAVNSLTAILMFRLAPGPGRLRRPFSGDVAALTLAGNRHRAGRR